jgi:hypothetical protein
MKFPAMPVRSGRDATLNFEKLQKELTEREQSVAIAYRSAAQNLAAATRTKIKLDKVIKDPGANLDVVTNFCYVVPADGYYHIDGSVAANIAAKAVLLVEIWVNGAEALTGTRVFTEAGIADGTASGILFLKKGEKVELVALNTGAECVLGVGFPEQNRLSVVRVA